VHGLSDRHIEILAAQVASVVERLGRCRPHEREHLAIARRQALEHLVDYLVEPDPDFNRERARVNRAAQEARDLAEAEAALARVGI